MIGYYAMGGGLGHLTRARAVAHTLGIERDVTVLTASSFAADPRVSGPMQIARVPEGIAAGTAQYHAWLDAQLAACKTDGLIVDAFPGGLFGELCGRPFDSMRLWHVARRLQWSVYARRLLTMPPRFEVSWIVEPLDAEHAAFLEAHSDRVIPLTLEDPPAAEVRVPDDLPDSFWLIAHAGPAHEIEELMAYALETRALERSRSPLVVSTPQPPGALPESCRYIDVYPATVLFPRAERIFTAAGFNCVRQLSPWRHKHWMLPFPRPLDDQYARKLACIDRAISPAISLTPSERRTRRRGYRSRWAETT
jgi:hypothetical protein